MLVVATHVWPVVTPLDYVYAIGDYKVIGYDGDPGMWESADREAGKVKTWIERGRPTW